jgi:hypothetical protein
VSSTASIEQMRRAVSLLDAHLRQQRHIHRWPHLAFRAAVKRGRKFSSRHSLRRCWTVRA